MKKSLAMFISIFLIIIVGLIGISFKGLIADELAHAEQVHRFVINDYTLVKGLTVIPGYHFIIAQVAKLFNVDSLMSFRTVTALLLFFILIPIFYYVSNRNIIKTWQFFLFPTMVTFYFLVYTDLFSLMFVLLAVYSAFKRWYVPSAVFIFLSYLIRQNNIFWGLYLIVYAYVTIKSEDTHIPFIHIIWKLRGYIIGAVIFVGILYGMGSIVMGDTSHHPFGFYFGNIWFMLFLFFFLFLPYNISQFSKIIEYLKNNKKILFLLIAIFLIGLGTYKVDHAYNHIAEKVWFNLILLWSISSPLATILFFIPILYSILVLINVEIPMKWWLFIVTFLVVGMSWLIEPRYYMVFYSFFLLFYKENKETEAYTTIYYALLSILFFAMFFKG
jgi:alpha-1,2-glucosyltransferase